MQLYGRSIVAVGTASARVAAMQNGAIQAALAIPPDTVLLADKGVGTLFDLAQQKVPTGNATQTTTRVTSASSAEYTRARYQPSWGIDDGPSC